MTVELDRISREELRELWRRIRETHIFQEIGKKLEQHGTIHPFFTEIEIGQFAHDLLPQIEHSSGDLRIVLDYLTVVTHTMLRRNYEAYLLPKPTTSLTPELLKAAYRGTQNETYLKVLQLFELLTLYIGNTIAYDAYPNFLLREGGGLGKVEELSLAPFQINQEAIFAGATGNEEVWNKDLHSLTPLSVHRPWGSYNHPPSRHLAALLPEYEDGSLYGALADDIRCHKLSETPSSILKELFAFYVLHYKLNEQRNDLEFHHEIPDTVFEQRNPDLLQEAVAHDPLQCAITLRHLLEKIAPSAQQLLTVSEPHIKAAGFAWKALSDAIVRHLRSKYQYEQFTKKDPRELVAELLNCSINELDSRLALGSIRATDFTTRAEHSYVGYEQIAELVVEYYFSTNNIAGLAVVIPNLPQTEIDRLEKAVAEVKPRRETLLQEIESAISHEIPDETQQPLYGTYIRSRISALKVCIQNEIAKRGESWKPYLEMIADVQFFFELRKQQTSRGLHNPFDVWIGMHTHPLLKQYGVTPGADYASPLIPHVESVKAYREQMIFDWAVQVALEMGIATEGDIQTLDKLVLPIVEHPIKPFPEVDWQTIRHAEVDDFMKTVVERTGVQTDFNNYASRLLERLLTGRFNLRGMIPTIMYDRKVLKRILSGEGPLPHLIKSTQVNKEMLVEQIAAAPLLRDRKRSVDSDELIPFFEYLLEIMNKPESLLWHYLNSQGELVWVTQTQRGRLLYAAINNGGIKQEDVLELGLDVPYELLLAKLVFAQGLRSVFEKTREKEIPHAFPSISENFEAQELYPLVLILRDLFGYSEADKLLLVANDIALAPGVPTVTIGSAGAGKTVSLRSLALAAYLHKLGIPIWMREGKMPEFDHVVLSLNDDESGARGSRFHSMVLRVAGILDDIFDLKVEDENTVILALFDELNRGTEDTHAVALIWTVLKTLVDRGCIVQTATHFQLLYELYREGKLDIPLNFLSSRFGEYKFTREIHDSEYTLVLRAKGFTDAFIALFDALREGKAITAPEISQCAKEVKERGDDYGNDLYKVLRDIEFIDSRGKLGDAACGIKISELPWERDSERTEREWISWFCEPGSATQRGDLLADLMKQENSSKEMELVHACATLIVGIPSDDGFGRRLQPDDLRDRYKIRAAIVKKYMLKPPSSKIIKDFFLEVTEMYGGVEKFTQLLEFSENIHSIDDSELAFGNALREKIKEAGSRRRYFISTITEMRNMSVLAAWLGTEGTVASRVQTSTDGKIYMEEGLFFGQGTLGGYYDTRRDSVSANAVKNIVRVSLFLESGKPAILSGDNFAGKTVSAKTLIFNIILAQLCGWSFTKGLRIPELEYIASAFNANISTDDNSSSMNEAQIIAHILMRAAQYEKNKVLVVCDELGAPVSSDQGSAFAALLLAALSKQGHYSCVTTHYHELERMIREQLGIICEPWGFVFDENDPTNIYRPQKGVRPGTSRGVQRAIYAIEKTELRNKDAIVSIFKRALQYLVEIEAYIAGKGGMKTEL